MNSRQRRDPSRVGEVRQVSEDTEGLPGHREISFDLTTPRQYTARGGWNVRCECGRVVGESGDEDLDQRWGDHLSATRPSV